MARRTFFSFHYKPDVTRAWVVRNSWVMKFAQGERDDARFFDSSVFEAAQRESDEVLKRFLRDGLKNTTVTCVLVGSETALRDESATKSSRVSYVGMVYLPFASTPSQDSISCQAPRDSILSAPYRLR
jgi:MTH538 TIR-like domain (DUF1863)